MSAPALVVPSGFPVFPGTVLAAGSRQPAVSAVQQRLNDLGCGPVSVDGFFGSQTMEAVELFQSRFADPAGHQLEVDGRVGPATWAALFGSANVPPVTAAPSSLLDAVLKVAATQVGVMENPLGSNRGPEVDQYLRSVGIDPATGSFAWCVAFVYFCFNQACKAMQPSIPNPMVKTAGVLEHWQLAASNPRATRISASEAQNQPSLIQPGAIFVISTGGGHGHSGLIEKVEAGRFTTIEGNTNNNGSREGIGVFRRVGRKISSINVGYVLYS
jgi:hypothetical protein